MLGIGGERVEKCFEIEDNTAMEHSMLRNQAFMVVRM